MQVARQTQVPTGGKALDTVSAEFAGFIATAVWLEKLTDARGREVLRLYALACQAGAGRDAARMLEALLTEYEIRRAQQDICW